MSGTWSIQRPCGRVPYVFRLFAFQRARASVVIAKQPTSTLLRITHGASATTASAGTATAAAQPLPRQSRNPASTIGE